MKVTSVHTYKFWVDWCNWLLVRVDTDEGLYGWGEGSLHGSILAVETAIHELADYLVGQEPSGVERHWHGTYHLGQMEKEQSARARVCTDPPIIPNGHLALPTRPGLGTDVRLDVLEALTFQPPPVSRRTESLWR